MDIKTNAGYILTDTVTIGESTFVLGIHESAPAQFVTWQCKNNDYFWGNYFTDRISAVKNLCERALNEAKHLEFVQKDIPQKYDKIKSKGLER